MRYVSVVIVPCHCLAKPLSDIGVVLQDRLNLYDPAIEPGILGINSVENGMLLSKDLHGLFGHGCSAFLKVREVDINSDIS
jgi:HNH endonuclease